ncbi:MAG: hypothetical protein AAGB00_12425 [Planctomycetota bacterium]
MAVAGKLRYAYLAFFSKPKSDRRLYRLVKRLRARKVVEFGIDSIERSLNLISVCQRYSPGEPISYTGLDWFEERPASLAPLSLIETHRRVKAAGAEARLMPGGPAEAAPAVANSLLGTDLLLVSPTADDRALADAWFYLPRILHDRSVVLRGIAEERGGGWEAVERSTIEAYASPRRSAA